MKKSEFRIHALIFLTLILLVSGVIVDLYANYANSLFWQNALVTQSGQRPIDISAWRMPWYLVLIRWVPMAEMISTALTMQYAAYGLFLCAGICVCTIGIIFTRGKKSDPLRLESTTSGSRTPL